MMGVVQRGKFWRRGGVRIEYIIAAIVCTALLVAMTAVLLSVSDRKAKRELVRQPNTKVQADQTSEPEETSAPSAPSAPSARPTPAAQKPAVAANTDSDVPVVVVTTPQPAPTKAPETTVVTVKPETPVVTVKPETPAVTVKPETPPANPDDTPVIVTMTPPTPQANTASEAPVVVNVTPQPAPAQSSDMPVVKVDPSQPAPPSGPEIASDPLDTLKIGTRPVGDNWVFGTSGGLVSVQQSPQENSRCLRLLDTNRAASVWAIRKFPAQSQQVGFECRFRVGLAADGYALAILGNDKPAVLMLTRDGELGCEVGTGEWHALQSYSANVWYTIRIVANVKDKTFNVSIDGVQRGENLKFRNPIQSADAWQVETPGKLTGTLFVNAMKVTER